MSAVAIPPIRTAGARPPVVPPFSTSFDPFSEGEEPMHKSLSNDVKALLKWVKASEPERFPVMLKLIAQRKRLIEEELRYERMMQPEALPPLMMHLYGLDFLGKEEDPIRTYVNLLNQLDDTAAELQRKMREQKLDSSTSPN